MGEDMFLNIQQDSVGCYARNSNCGIRVFTIGEDTIFENSAWCLVRRQKCMIFKNIVISDGESTNSAFRVASVTAKRVLIDVEKRALTNG